MTADRDPGPGPNPDDLNKMLLDAQRLHRAGEFDAARVGYEQLLDINPKYAPALHFLGILLYRMEEESRAVELIEESIALSPHTYDAYKNLGNIHLECERFGDAEACYRKAEQLQPGDGALSSNLCVALRNQGRYEESIEAGLKAIRLLPDDSLGWYSLANSYMKLGKTRQAVKHYNRAVQLSPDFVPAWDALGQATLELEQGRWLGRNTLKRTRKVYERWLEQQPNNRVAAFMVRALSGDLDLDRAPEDFVRDMFDQYASTFNRRLSNLEYRVPELVVNELSALMGPPQGDLEILDAGCGTGLSAAGLRPFAKRLDGVDLSPGMLEKARNLSLYDRLEAADLCLYMARKSNRYDVIVLADTLCYFGALEEVAQAAAGALKQNGVLIFSVEWLDESKSGRGYRLHPHGRYRHSEKYVQTVLQAAGLASVKLRKETLRMEKGVPVAGLIVAAHS